MSGVFDLRLNCWCFNGETCICGDEEKVLRRYAAGKPLPPMYGLAMYESDILPPDWEGEWGGFTACRRCYTTFTNVSAPLSVRDARIQLDREDGYHL